MGIIWSRFKKKESTKDKLQKIQEKIDKLEEYKLCTEQRGKKLVGSLVIYSFIIYLISAVICYFYYLPPSFKERLLYATPFAIFIILIYLVKRTLTWYYHWKVGRNERELLNFKQKKVEILNQVMETETYKIATDILETYAPEQLRKSLSIRSPIGTPSRGSQRIPVTHGLELRKRIVPVTPAVSQNIRPSIGSIRPLQISPRGSTPLIRPSITSTPRNSSVPMTTYTDSTPMNSTSINYRDGNGFPPGPPMPRPVLPRERGMLDRFVEYLVGDGPSNRYALVCRQCESHNGMALKEEFPYIAFRCAYCYYWNPARKQKPAPPKLETLNNTQLERTLQKEETGSTSSGDDNDVGDASGECDSNTTSSSNECSTRGNSDIEDNIPAHSSVFFTKGLVNYKDKSIKESSSNIEEKVSTNEQLKEGNDDLRGEATSDAHSDSFSSESGSESPVPLDVHPSGGSSDSNLPDPSPVTLKEELYSGEAITSEHHQS